MMLCFRYRDFSIISLSRTSSSSSIEYSLLHLACDTPLFLVLTQLGCDNDSLFTSCLAHFSFFDIVHRGISRFFLLVP